MKRNLDGNGIVTLLAVALASCVAMSPTQSLAGSGTDIPIIVLVDDLDSHSTRRTNGIVREALDELRDQLSRYGFSVKTEEMLAAALDWKIEGRKGTTELLKIAYAAKDTGRPEFDVRGVVIFSLMGSTKDRGFATQVKITVNGNIYDAVDQRHLTKFGPLMESFTGPAGCGSMCMQEIGRPLATKVAAIVGDEARKELKQLTKGGGGGGIGSAASSGGGAGGNLTTTYAVHFENFTTPEMLTVIDTMEGEFPGFVRSVDVIGTPNHGTYGYVSTASGQKVFKWINVMLMDMGLDPDSKVQIRKSGSEFTLKKLGMDEPVKHSADSNSRFN